MAIHDIFDRKPCDRTQTSPIDAVQYKNPLIQALIGQKLDAVMYLQMPSQYHLFVYIPRDFGSRILLFILVNKVSRLLIEENAVKYSWCPLWVRRLHSKLHRFIMGRLFATAAHYAVFSSVIVHNDIQIHHIFKVFIYGITVLQIKVSQTV